MPAELDEVERRIMQLEIEREALPQGDGRGLAESGWQKHGEGAGRPAGASPTSLKAHWQQEKEAIDAHPRASRSRSSRSSGRGERAERAGDLARGGRAPLRQARPSCRSSSTSRELAWPSCKASSRCSRRRSTRRTSPRWSPSGPASRSASMMEGEIAEAAAAWRSACTSAWSARTRPSRPSPTPCGAARAGLQDPNRPIGSLHLPGPDGRGQDRAGPGAGRVPVRRRAGDGPHRHVRVHGEAHRGPADRRASGLRRLRRGRPAHRGSPPAALLA